MSQAVVDFIEDFIDGMNFTQRVQSFSTDGNNTTLFLDDPLFSRAGLIMNVDGVDLEIVSVNNVLCTVTVTGVIANPVLATLQKPKYFHNTPIANNAHVSFLEGVDKFPYIYLVQVIDEEFVVDVTSSTDENVVLLFYFIDEHDFRNNDTDDDYATVIPQLRRLVDKFVTDIQLQPRVNKFVANYIISDFVKFGESTANRGALNSMFNDRTSAIQLQITLPLRNNCDVPTPFTCLTLCEQVAGNTSQSTVDCIDDAGKTAEVQALICTPVVVPDFILDRLANPALFSFSDRQTISTFNVPMNRLLRSLDNAEADFSKDDYGLFSLNSISSNSTGGLTDGQTFKEWGDAYDTDLVFWQDQISGNTARQTNTAFQWRFKDANAMIVGIKDGTHGMNLDTPITGNSVYSIYLVADSPAQQSIALITDLGTTDTVFIQEQTNLFQFKLNSVNENFNIVPNLTSPVVLKVGINNTGFNLKINSFSTSGVWSVTKDLTTFTINGILGLIGINLALWGGIRELIVFDVDDAGDETLLRTDQGNHYDINI